MIVMKTRFYLQENRPKVIATNTHYFYIGILVALENDNTKAKYRLNTNSYPQYKSFGVITHQFKIHTN